jgi:hypothetical protein
MNEDDLALRNLTYARFAELGRAPTAAEMAVAVRRDRVEVIAAWERLHAEHALVLDLATFEIRMANPFSAVPTAHRVQAVVVRELRLGCVRHLRCSAPGRAHRDVVSGVRPIAADRGPGSASR